MKTRKSLLISSVAMLLVAMLALGTATFAWFTTSTQATADQLSVKTIKSSEIKLAKTTGAWDDQIHYGVAGKVLKPASSADGTNWYAATAADKKEYNAKVSTVTSLSDLDGYVYKEQLNVSNHGKADVENVTISFNLAETEAVAGKKYVRVALVPTNERSANAAVTADNFKANVFSSAADSAAAISSVEVDAQTGVVTSFATKTVTAQNGANASINIGTLVANGTSDETKGTTDTKYFNLYVWFEGQDADCSDYNAGNEMPEITFTVTGDTVETTN